MYVLYFADWLSSAQLFVLKDKKEKSKQLLSYEQIYLQYVQTSETVN